jgi:hypothetical protein
MIKNAPLIFFAFLVAFSGISLSQEIHYEHGVPFRPKLVCDAPTSQELKGLLSVYEQAKSLNESQVKRLETLSKRIPGGCLLPNVESSLYALFERYGIFPCDPNRIRFPIQTVLIGEYHGKEAEETRARYRTRAKNDEIYLVEEGSIAFEDSPNLREANDYFASVLTALIHSHQETREYLAKKTDQKTFSENIRDSIAGLSNSKLVAEMMKSALIWMDIEPPAPNAETIRRLKKFYSDMASPNISGEKKELTYTRDRALVESYPQFHEGLTKQLIKDFLSQVNRRERRFAHNPPSLDLVKSYLGNPDDGEIWDKMWDVLVAWRDESMTMNLLKQICQSKGEKPIYFIGGLSHIPGIYLHTKQALEEARLPHGFGIQIDRSVLKNKQFIEGLARKLPNEMRLDKFFMSVQ